MSEDTRSINPANDLADLMYPPATPEEPETPEAPAEASTETLGAETPEVVAETPEEPIVAETAADTPGDDTQIGEGDTPEVDTEEVEMWTLSQLAEHLETDTDFLMGLTVEQKVNGETVQVKLDDALRSYRTQEAAETHLAEAKAKANEAAEFTAQYKHQLGESATVLGTMINGIEQGLKAEVDNTDWASLRADDPAEYAARKTDVEERQGKVTKLREDAAVSYRAALEQMQALEQKQREENLPREREALYAKLPDWSDKETAEREGAAVLDYLSMEGYSQQEIDAVQWKGGYLSLAVKAMRYDKAKTKSDATRKKIVTIPKVLKPGSKSEGDGKPTPAPEDRASALYG